MNEGVLIFAHNNSEIDYGSIALVNSYLINHHLKKPVSLVTNEGTFNYISKKYKDKLTIFDKIIFTDKHLAHISQRNIRDTIYDEKVVNWYNCDRIFAYDFSPYDKTLVVDCDYLIFNNKLNYVFDNNDNYLMNHSIIPLQRLNNHFKDEERVNLLTVKQYWATAFYFDKTDYTKSIFEFAKHLFENYNYYSLVYKATGKIFRNDHLFSIVNHTFSGLLGADIKSLPIEYILTAPDYDDLIDVSEDCCTFLVSKPGETYDFHLTKIKNTNIHIMNKQSIVRNIPKMLEIYS